MELSNMLNNLKSLSIDIAKRENIEFMTPKYIKSLSQEELFDFVQFYVHEKTKDLLKRKQFFENTSTVLLNLIYEGKIDIKAIARKELIARIGNKKN